MKIIFVRHGDVSGGKGHFHGQTDEPLMSKGKEEAEEISNTVKSLGIKKIISSPLKRAKETAQIIGDKLNIQPTSNNALTAWNLGNYVGLPVDRYLAHIRFYISHPERKVPGGEPFNSFAQRLLGFLNSHKNEDGLLVVTHGRNILLSKAWSESGRNGTKYNKNSLLNNDKSTEHGGYAILDSDGFRIETPHKTKAGAS